MKGIILLFITCSAGLSYGQNTWSQKDSVNGAGRSVSSSFMLNGEAYIVAGLDENGFRRKMYSYFFAQDDWDQEESLGGINESGLNRGSAAAFSIGFSAFVVGGQGETAGFLSDTWEFDLVTNTWSQAADFGGGARRQAVGFSINGIGYVGTGNSPTGFKKDMYSYDPTANSWTQVNDFGGTARKEAVGFTMGGQAYVGTGDDGVMRNDFWQYEPATDSWDQKPDLPGNARKGAVGWGNFPNAYVCTGEDITFTYTNDLYEYNYYLDSWVQRTDMPGPGRTGAIAFPLLTQGFVATGYDGTFLDDMYTYTPIVGLDELIEAANVSLYPNPAVDYCHVSTSLKGLECNIYSLSGKRMNDRLEIIETGTGFTIKRNGASAGNYLVRLVDPHFGTVYSGKIIFS
ncbi:MAG: N-acetylneuraminic acid mutarotase [Flavobacteriaceae bacterium]|jgi:N-acetylneuraminic acid mutarotase